MRTTITIILVMFFTLGAIAYMTDAITCHAKWGESGMTARYGFFSGCQVQRKDGTWVPASTIRDITP